MPVVDNYKPMTQICNDKLEPAITVPLRTLKTDLPYIRGISAS